MNSEYISFIYSLLFFKSLGFNSHTRNEKYLNSSTSETINFRDFILIRFFARNLTYNTLISH